VGPRVIICISKTLQLLLIAGFLHCVIVSGQRKSATRIASLPNPVLLRIMRAEDERRWDRDLVELSADPSPAVRQRAALAAGRIGDERAVPLLIPLVKSDSAEKVRAMAAFALGEVESPGAIDALSAQLADKQQPFEVRARAVEALGKIAAALPKSDEALKKSVGTSILQTLEFEGALGEKGENEVILLALTAALRARPEGSGAVISKFLNHSESRIRADAANALARLKVTGGNDRLRNLLTTDPDPIVRANAVRVLAATDEKNAVDAIVERLSDGDERVRVSAIRALGTLKGDKAAKALAALNCERRAVQIGKRLIFRRDEAECLELITSLGHIFQGTEDQGTLAKLRTWRSDISHSAPELEVALARISAADYLQHFGNEATARKAMRQDWHLASNLAQGLGEIAALPDETKDKRLFSQQAISLLRAMLDYRNATPIKRLSPRTHSEYAIPDVLRAFAEFKTTDLATVLRTHLREPDVVVRATAAELLGDLPPDTANAAALIAALPIAMNDKMLNDAALAILDSLGKQNSVAANDAVKTALSSNDYLVRKRAITLLKANAIGDFSARLGTVQTRNRTADYRRALSRIGRSVRATITTNRGPFVIELLPAAAPLTVDNFVELAKRGYFNGITFHRVVPNFVIQGGDPRGDGNGGPGYQIRCEINQEPFERGAVGMALSGKDTGGSQWFVTHSPQPHLDGGYTVFGNAILGMGVVDAIVRGDVIRKIQITETSRRN
ncbi:MAG TPA: peptidylprolyl isomerase, partial [Pyrinomonadaceae bacterium]